MPLVVVKVAPTAGAPDITGTAVFEGGRVTAAVLAEVAVAEPAEFVPVTLSRKVLPASAVCTTYVLLVAPDILVVPLCHWYVYVGVGDPAHVPVLPVKV